MLFFVILWNSVQFNNRQFSTLWFDIYEYSGVTLERSKYEWFLSSYWSLNWRTRRRHERYIKGQPHVSHLRYHILFIHLYM